MALFSENYRNYLKVAIILVFGMKKKIISPKWSIISSTFWRNIVPKDLICVWSNSKRLCVSKKVNCQGDIVLSRYTYDRYETMDLKLLKSSIQPGSEILYNNCERCFLKVAIQASKLRFSILRSFMIVYRCTLRLLYLHWIQMRFLALAKVRNLYFLIHCRNNTKPSHYMYRFQIYMSMYYTIKNRFRHFDFFSHLYPLSSGVLICNVSIPIAQAY